jgi:hypothetical protein
VKVVYARSSVVLPLPAGYPIRILIGSHWRADDPVVRDHPDLFSEDPRTGLSQSAALPDVEDAPVEQATAGPGERRAVRRS